MNIRNATAQDVPAIMALVRELAIYEKAEHELINTEDQMLKDGFGDNPLFKAIVAERKGVILGMSLYYFRYSTWKGKRLYLEDYIVTESERGSGIGKLLFDATVAKAKEEKCSGMAWQVLDWNEPGINFYKKYPTSFDNGWINCQLEL
jgi:GNAT superfamily N-acetyltransferase